MKLHGSCHCTKVSFALESAHPYPFNVCYCSICRKTAGGGGYAINLGGEAASLTVTGEAFISVYRAMFADANGVVSASPCERRFCNACGSALWVWDPRWPDLIHPFASALDTPLPLPAERTHLMVAYKPDWVALQQREGDQCFDEYPLESIAEWHQRLKLEC